MTKHLILIHGRATKPAEEKKKEMVTRSLINGLSRVDPEVARDVHAGDVKVSFIYYGHISNQLILAANPDHEDRLTSQDPLHPGIPCEDHEKYQPALETLLSTTDFSKAKYKQLLKDHPDKSWHDDLAAGFSPLINLIGLSDNIIRKATPDMGAYLTKRETGSAIRKLLTDVLKPALIAGDDICLVSHSMGCIVSYDVLWKLSRMSEHRFDVANKKVNLWLTIGNPLGEPGVQKNLYDADEDKGGRHPKNIITKWHNLVACDDFVAHDEDMADDFKRMRHDVAIKDLKQIYNMYVGTGGVNPHKFYGYLDHPQFAQEIVDWVKG